MSIERPLCLSAATTFIIRTPIKVDVANVAAGCVGLDELKEVSCRGMVAIDQRNLTINQGADSSIRAKLVIRIVLAVHLCLHRYR